MRGYTPKALVFDFLSGITVGAVAFPLAIAFAAASGVNPAQGLVTALVAGLIISVFGGSRVQIGGPAVVFTVLSCDIVRVFGYSGLVTATVMAGAMVILLGIFKFGPLVKFIPLPLIAGVMAGIAVLVIVFAIGDFFGLSAEGIPGNLVGSLRAYARAASSFNPWALATALASLAIIGIWPRIGGKIPALPVAVVAVTAAVWLLKIPVETLGSRFGSLSASLSLPSLAPFAPALMGRLFSPALAIAVLVSFESLMGASVSDGMIGHRSDSNRELVAQGIANIACVFSGGIPATGTAGRTAINAHSGGTTPVSGIVHALTLFAILLFLGRFAAYIPMPVIAAILVSSAVTMAGVRGLASALRGPGKDVAVLIVAFALTVFIDLTLAMETAFIVAGILFVIKLGSVPAVKEIRYEMTLQASPQSGDADSHCLRTIPKGAVVYEISGPLVSGALQRFSTTFFGSLSGCGVLILRMRNSIFIDEGGLRAIEDLCADCRKKGITLLLSEIHTLPFMLASQTGFVGKIGAENILGNLDEALKKAASLLGVPYVKYALAAKSVSGEKGQD